jgi:hypothetical protein
MFLLEFWSSLYEIEELVILRTMSKSRSKRNNREENEEEIETTDIYDEEQLEEMLENDELTEAEYSFMLGREKVRKRKSLGLERRGHQDTYAGELAKNEYEDD